MEETAPKKISKISICYIVIAILIIYSGIITSGYLKQKEREENEQKFSLVSDEVAKLTVEEFLQKQKTLTITYRPMGDPLRELFSKSEGYWGLYFEDLTSGSWIGINERETEFVPASLIKIPTMVAVLKKVELGEIKIDDKVSLVKEDLDSRYGELWERGENYKISIEELLDHLITKSDNTALNTLNNRILTPSEIAQAQYALGLPIPDNSEHKISPRMYSNMLRSLYLSSYLRRTFSQKALTILSESGHESGISAGVPEEIKVAHKIGVYEIGGYHHDCGIIYYPNKPYLLCVMSKDTNQEDANKVMEDASKIIYEYISKN